MQTAIVVVVMARVLPMQNRVGRMAGLMCIGLFSQRTRCQGCGLPEHGKNQQQMDESTKHGLKVVGANDKVYMTRFTNTS